MKLAACSAALIATALCAELGLAAEAAVSIPPGTPGCESEATTFDSRTVVCALEPVGASRRYRLQVNFAGGHDDTIASMAPRLDGATLACEDGSKTRLMGEDGDVSLVCVFSVPGRRAETHRFESLISWSHAQYVSYSFGPG